MNIDAMIKLPAFLQGMPPLTLVSLERDAFSWVRLRNSRKEPVVVDQGVVHLEPEWFDWKLTGSPLVDRRALADRLGPTLEKLARHGADIGLLVPDGCFRLPVVDLEVVPKNRKEWPALFQFKLRRVIPYRIQEARMGWIQLQGASEGEGRFLLGLIHETVASGLESFFKDHGLKVGVLAPRSMEWMLWAFEQIKEPTLLVHGTEDSLVLTFGREGRPEVVRIREYERGLQDDPEGFSRWLLKEIESTELYLTEHLKFQGTLSVFRGGQGLEGDDIPGQKINLFSGLPGWQENLMASAHGRWPS